VWITPWPTCVSPGSFPLHDTTLALNALLPTLPVRIEQRTPWWVTVKGRP
jgi:transmembrane sensor